MVAFFGWRRERKERVQLNLQEDEVLNIQQRDRLTKTIFV